MKSINEELKTKRPQKDLHIQKGLENSQNEPEKLQNKLFKAQKELKIFHQELQNNSERLEYPIKDSEGSRRTRKFKKRA